MSSAEILARSGEGWKSGPIGFAVILLLCVAVYFLFKSMSKHMRKVREEFPDELPLSPDEQRAARRRQRASGAGTTPTQSDTGAAPPGAPPSA